MATSPKLVLAVAPVLVALALPATGQAVTFGSKLDREPDTSDLQRLCDDSNAPSPCTRVGYRFPGQDPQIQGSPIDGVVVRFRLRSETKDPVTFRVARMTEDNGTALATSVGTGPTVPLKGDRSIEQFDARVPLKTGDFLALDGAVISAQYANDGGNRHYVFGSLVDGEGPRGSSGKSSKQLLLQADVEPDSDQDGFGDLTQDKCPTDKSTASTCPVPDNGAPVLSGVALAPGSFRAASSGNAVQTRAPIGARVFYQLSETATVTWSVEKGTVGRLVGGKCVRRTRANRSRRHCVRYTAMTGTFKTTGGSGQNGFRFSGRMNGHKLAVGSYRLVGTAKDPAGNKSKTTRRNFRIVS
jgi:hypothetical protein